MSMLHQILLQIGLSALGFPELNMHRNPHTVVMECDFDMGVQGLARHSQQDVNLLLHDDLSALSTMLGEKRYLVGDAPCEADAALFGVLDQIVYGRLASPELKAIVRQYPLLYLHTRRVRDTFFPDKDPSLTGRLVYGKSR